MILPLTLLLLAQPGPKPVMEPDPTPKVELKVGERTISPVRKGTAVSCTDGSVVQATMVDGRYELKGLKSGSTVCSFGQGKDASKYVDITVK